MLRKNVEKRALLDNMDGVFLAIDEICDNGWVHFALFHYIQFQSDFMHNNGPNPVFIKRKKESKQYWTSVSTLFSN